MKAFIHFAHEVMNGTSEVLRLDICPQLRGGGYEPELHYPNWRRVHKPIDRHHVLLESLTKLMDGIVQNVFVKKFYLSLCLYPSVFLSVYLSISVSSTLYHSMVLAKLDYSSSKNTQSSEFLLPYQHILNSQISLITFSLSWY